MSNTIHTNPTAPQNPQDPSVQHPCIGIGTLNTRPPSQPRELRIFQYNVNKSRKKVMIGLLQDRRIAEFDILAI
jgi:hypothetical protein